MDRDLVKLIAESLAPCVSGFDVKKFVSSATRGLKSLELKDRAKHIALAMAQQLPEDFNELSPLLIRSMGPKLKSTGGNGLSPFFYFPHSQLISMFAHTHFSSGMQANYELTQRFTAEFSIRPMLIEHETRCLKKLARWTVDPNPHVRRLVSEGTRPRLPWAMHLKRFQQDPAPVIPLLEKLKNDSSLYVRRSVANHIGDIAKDNLDIALDICDQWLVQASSLKSSEQSENRKWIIRHALRNPAKKGIRLALQIRSKAS